MTSETLPKLAPRLKTKVQSAYLRLTYNLLEPSQRQTGRESYENIQKSHLEEIMPILEPDRNDLNPKTTDEVFSKAKRYLFNRKYKNTYLGLLV